MGTIRETGSAWNKPRGERAIVPGPDNGWWCGATDRLTQMAVELALKRPAGQRVGQKK